MRLPSGGHDGGPHTGRLARAANESARKARFRRWTGHCRARDEGPP